MIYPLLVFLLAWALFVFYTWKLADVFLRLAEDTEMPGRIFFETLDHWGRSAAYWGPVVPVAVFLAAGLWWRSSGRVSLTDPKAAGVLFGWLPGMRPMLRNFQIATFADVLGLLVEHKVPLADAVTLAADAAGGRKLKEASGQLAEAIRRGEPPETRTPGAAALPPLLVWLLSRGQAQGALPAALRHAAEMYHQRAFYLAEAARVFTPVICTLVVGGTVTLLYAMLVLGSWFTILRTFAYPS
jgi:general secretion pathway protein F